MKIYTIIPLLFQQVVVVDRVVAKCVWLVFGDGQYQLEQPSM
jgi:hypothetical protein